MEVSKTLQENIRNVQNQLKLAIQNHQVILLKHQSNPSSGNVKVQLWEIQKHIISLGEAQKRLVQQLRKELEANSTNCTLTPAPVHSPQGPSPSPPQGPSPPPPQEPPANHRQPAPDSVPRRSPSRCALPKERECPAPAGVGCPAASAAVAPAPTASPRRDDLVGVGSTSCKLDFMASLGLVTQEVLAEMRNRRVERKRRSTANHVQFVYGNSWDICKRKKGNYLLTSSGSKVSVELPRGASPPEEKVPTLAPVLRNASLPESLTIQRITSSEPLCVVCRKTENVQVCAKCSSSYHNTCVSDSNCPRCCKYVSGSPNGTASPTISDEAEARAADEEQCSVRGEEQPGAAQGTAGRCHSGPGCHAR
ncbi:PHD finger protein 21A-like isoform X2 [Bacillus rossius redtenbacheri]|uniref:PHD finger protein 21A-like isoform X2 n=1 Tax=Bacillus rossius redtenbacheri TaxID=93214 RepID=UPI002FDDBBD4